ncbi:MAG: Plug domain-containing protein, partial [Bacteroidales bacterium]|nr:Plug domain-containing protein [Bacteroidales bacterium]
MKKICFFTVFLVIYCQCFSQKDTSFILPEINIIEAKSKIGMWNIQPTDTTSNVLLTQQLELSSPMHLKTYNPGGNVSFSFHGLGSNHTLMLWNGFPINSSFLGQPLIYGLGLLEVGKSALFPGSLSAAIFPGGPGAILALDERSSTKKAFVIEYGSYKTMRTLLKWENKWKKHRTAPSFSFSRSNNDYHFINNAFGDPN